MEKEQGPGYNSILNFFSCRTFPSMIYHEEHMQFMQNCLFLHDTWLQTSHSHGNE